MTIRQTLPDHFPLSWFLPALMVNWIVPIMVMGLFRPSVDGRVCAVWLGLKLISSAFWMLHEVKRGRGQGPDWLRYNAGLTPIRLQRASS
jgi:hypothetical protein